MSLNGNASMDIAVALDPMQMYVDAQMSGKMAVMDQEQGGEIAMTIYGVPGSAAESFAKMNELTFIEVKCSIGARDDLGRPTTSAIENKRSFTDYLNTL